MRQIDTMMFCPEIIAASAAPEKKIQLYELALIRGWLSSCLDAIQFAVQFYMTEFEICVDFRR